jgi:hypothetical protein
MKITLTSYKTVEVRIPLAKDQIPLGEGLFCRCHVDKTTGRGRQFASLEALLVHTWRTNNAKHKHRSEKEGPKCDMRNISRKESSTEA